MSASRICLGIERGVNILFGIRPEMFVAMQCARLGAHGSVFGDVVTGHGYAAGGDDAGETTRCGAVEAEGFIHNGVEGGEGIEV